MSELLKALDFDERDLPPSTVDLDAALRTGRGRARRNRVLAVATAATMVLVVATGVALAVDRRPSPRPVEPSPTGWQCTVQEIPRQHRIVDPTGTVLVSGSKQDPITMTVNGGPPRQIAGLPGTDPVPLRVSTTGVIVGRSSNGDLVFGWKYHDGRVTILPAPAGATMVQAWAVNARGDVLGWSQRPIPSRATPVVNEVVRWLAASPGTYEVLSVPGAHSPTPGRIRDDGTVLGSAEFPQEGVYGVIWHLDGTVERLRSPAGSLYGLDGDWAFGNTSKPDGLFGFRYNLRTGESVDLGAFQPGWELADGRLVGASGAVGTPAIWHNGVIEPLPLPPSITRAMPVSAGGRTIYGNAGGRDVDLVWRC